MSGATLSSLAVAFPEQRRINGWWEEHHPELVAHAREATLAKLWADFGTGEPSAYDRAFAPYLRDAFRGSVERRVMGPEDSARSLCTRAIREALDAGGFEPGDIDFVLVNALRHDAHVVGDAAYLARELGLRAPAICFESACSSALVGLGLARDLVRAGSYGRVMVVTCCTYTRDVDPGDSFSWFLGDGAAAFIVEGVRDEHEGVLALHTVPTLETCGAFAYELGLDAQDQPRLWLRGDRRIAGQSIRDHSEAYLRQCVDGALSKCGLRLEQIDMLVCNTPTAWYAEFCRSVLGLGEQQVIDNYPRFANCGPSLWPNNLHTALASGRLRPGALVLGYSVGSVSTACAAVLRVGEIGLGPVPV